MAEPEATSLSSAEPRALWGLTRPFALLSLPRNSLRLPPTLRTSSTATGPDKVVYPMLKHLPRSGMDFLLHIFNLSWSTRSFPFIWKTFSIIPIHKIGKLLDSPASFGLSLSPPAYQSCLNASFYVVVVVGYPTPSEGWGHGGGPWSPRSRAPTQDLNQRSYRDRKSPKSERRKESVAGQCRMR